jgi:flagellin-like protein
MRLFRKNELAVSPVIGVILMVAITVILAAVIAAFVFGIGGQQAAAPTASIVAANNPDTPGADLKIQHKGGDMLKGGDWKLSVVPVGDSPLYNTSVAGSDLAVGAQIAVNTTTANVPLGLGSVITNSSTYNALCVATNCIPLTTGQKYDVKLVHVPSNAMLLDTVVEVR